MEKIIIKIDLLNKLYYGFKINCIDDNDFVRKIFVNFKTLLEELFFQFLIILNRLFFFHWQLTLPPKIQTFIQKISNFLSA